MAGQIGILADGTIISCCLDYEGEMGYGNIQNDHIYDIGIKKRRKRIAQNALSCKLCQRCKGYVFVFDKEPISGGEQLIGGYSYDWNNVEKDIYGHEGRWSKAISTCFVYVRIDGASYLKLNVHSIFSSNTEYRLRLFEWNNKFENFKPVFMDVFTLPENEDTEVKIEYNFVQAKFYRIELYAPTFQPKMVYGVDDTRILGLAVYNMLIGK